MLKKTLLLASIMTSTSTASADSYDATQPPPQTDRYFGVTGSGGISSSLLRAGVGIEGGHRVAATSWFLRAQGEMGLSAGLYVEGRYSALRAGVETRRCAGYATKLCGFIGADVGIMLDSFTVTLPAEEMSGIPGEETSASSETLLVVPRVGVEVGAAVRLRAIVEAPFYRNGDPEPGVNLAVGVGYAF